MRVPASWNGTVIRDLDYASNAGSRDSWRNYSYLLAKGYALIGTGRHSLRAFRYDPAVEIANLDRVLDMFDKRFRRPDRVIQLGCSGGGAVTLGVAEDFSSRIDGAVAMAAHIPVWQMNTFLDGWFTLKALIAPDLPVVDLPFEPSGEIRRDIPEAWRRAINAAQQTPEGRARIALAFTLGQWPAWVNGLTPQPAPRGSGGAAAQHVPRGLPDGLGPRRQQPDQEGACCARTAAVVEHGDRLPGVLRERQRVVQTRCPAAVSGSRPVSLDADLARSTRLPASRLLPTPSSGGTRRGERRRVIRRFPFSGSTRSATRAFLRAWCRATTI